MPEAPRFVPAAGRAAFNGWYDLGVAATMRERRWRPLIVEQARRSEPQVVVDVGCGTGTLTTALAASLPSARLIGVDGDPSILERARAKPLADRVHWKVARANDLPLPDASVDVVVSTLLFHHLDQPTKKSALAEMARVLRPGGRLLVADWGVPHDRAMRIAFFGLQCLDGFDNTAENARGVLHELITTSGFSRPVVLRRLRTVLGSFEVLTSHRHRRVVNEPDNPRERD